jgi:MFS family permease
MIVAAISFALLTLLPIDFSYIWFALLLLLNGLGMGLFSSPNRAGIMNSLPPNQRGSGAGMVATFQNSAMVLSIGIFFTLIITGLAASLPHALASGLTAHGVPHAAAARVSHLPPTSSVFAALLGYNPMQHLLAPVLPHLGHAKAAYLTGRSFFPSLIAGPFAKGLHDAFYFAVVGCLVAAVASWLRGGKYYHREPEAAAADSEEALAGPIAATAPVQPGAEPATVTHQGNGNGNGQQPDGRTRTHASGDPSAGPVNVGAPAPPPADGEQR